MVRIEHEPSARRFVARTEHGEGELAYEEGGARVLDLVHTFVPPEARGEGVADALATEAFRWARENDYRVIASCPYVRGWLEEHPAEKELVDRG